MDVILLTKKLVSIESTDPGCYEFDIEKFLKQELEKLKQYDVNVYESELNDKSGRKNLMAVFSNGNIKSDFILICHMDTVVVGSDWTKDPFVEKDFDDRIYGRGSTDMKSGLAVAFKTFEHIVKNFKKENLKKNFKIIFTVDEEANMKGVEKVIEDKWVGSDSLVADLEPTDKQIQISHKGRFWVKIKIFGKTAHASMPELGIDANACVAEIISYIRKQIAKLDVDKELGKTTATFGLMKGGYQPYVVPDYSEVYIDFRLTPPTDNKTIIKIIEDSIKYTKNEISKDVDIKYEITGDRAFVKRNENSILCKELCDVLNEIYNQNKNEDYKATINYFSGYTDTAVIASTLNNKETLSYGPGSLSLAHKPDEYVLKSDILRCEEVYKKLAERICIK